MFSSFILDAQKYAFFFMSCYLLLCKYRSLLRTACTSRKPIRQNFRLGNPMAAKPVPAVPGILPCRMPCIENESGHDYARCRTRCTGRSNTFRYRPLPCALYRLRKSG